MASQQHDISHRWSLVLAGGEGERTRPFIEQWLGYHKLKQFCSFVGTRSMLQHTWSRADQLTLPEQKVTVVARQHAAEISAQMMEGACGQVISQPHNCDTAAGIFLPLTYLRSRDPQATVIIYPSDHFVFPENRFVEAVRDTIGAAEIMSNRIMLLGVRPTCLELGVFSQTSGEKLARRDRERQAGQGDMLFQARDKSVMIAGCQRRGTCWTPTDSPGFVQGPRSRGYSAIRRLGLSGWRDVKKNGVRRVWNPASEFLRPQDPADSRPVVRGDAHLPGGGDPPGSMSPVRQGEARDVSMAGDQPVLHAAVCLVCGATLPGNHGQGSGQRAQARLEDRQEPGEGVYARAAPAHGACASS